MNSMRWAASFGLALAMLPGIAAAQGIHVTPAFGVFIPASDLEGIRDGVQTAEVSREGTLGIGLNIESGWLRGSIAYASGATLSAEGTEGDIGDGSVLAIAADIVVRPLPRLLVQPYLLGGAGFKNQSFSYDDDGIGNALQEDQRDLTLHVGIGADLMFGRFGIMAEISDYISQDGNDEWGQHDAFAMVGLRLKLGGN
ncbi:hypothetical protein BH23GEM10_BH23GEM10_17070 [soil metagenome]